jgi:MFS family permease
MGAVNAGPRASSGDERADMSDMKQRIPIGRVLILRNFWPYFTGNLLSNAGTWFQNIAAVLLVYRLTRSPFLVGVVNFSQFAAVLLLAPVAGNAADRFDRRGLVVVTQLAAGLLALLLAFLTATDVATPAIVIAMTLALGATTALATPALQAVVPSLVSRAELPSAIALVSVTFNLARALGPIAAVFVIANYGLAAAFAVNALSFLALVGGIALVRPRSEGDASGVRPRLRDSVALVYSRRALLAPLLVVAAVSLTSDPVNTLTPSFSTEIYGAADTFTGVLVGAFGVGAVAAAFTLIPRSTPSYRLIVFTLALEAGGMAAFALSSSPAVGLAGLFFAGFGFLGSITTSTSLLHLALEDAHRGRVMAMWSVAFQGSRPVGSLVDGTLASLAGIRIAGMVMAVPALAASLGLAAAVLGRSRQPAGGGQVEPRTTSSGESDTVTGSSEGS